VGQCLAGGISLQECLTGIQNALPPLMAALAGLGILGVGHKVEKASGK
jgi:hypothetical protein